MDSLTNHTITPRVNIGFLSSSVQSERTGNHEFWLCIWGEREYVSTRILGVHRKKSDATVLSVTENLFGTQKVFGRFIGVDF